MNWAEFYAARLTDSYLAHVKKRYADHINAIFCQMKPGDVVAELGVGTGTITRSLMDRSDKEIHHVVDVCPKMLDYATQRCSNVISHLQDIRVPLAFKADVIHSHGVLEHFSDDDIRKVINAHRGSAQIHYVPGLYLSPSFGDERLMSVEQWQDICNPDHIFTFNDGLDYCMIFK